MHNYKFSKFYFYLTLILTIIFITSCGGGGDSSDTPKTNACGVLGLNTRIINGTDCSDSFRSPIVRIFVEDQGQRVAFCTGTMLSNNKVLTAAHCVTRNMRNFGIFIENDDTVLEIVQGTSFKAHPQFGVIGGIPVNDVAIMTLNRGVGLPTMPIYTSANIEKGDIFSIFGYGTDDTGDISSFLRSGEMKIEEVTPNNILALFKGEGSNTCTGDSGGPALLTRNNQTGLIGATSSGQNVDCQPDDISNFINLQSSVVLDFIRQEVPGLRLI